MPCVGVEVQRQELQQPTHKFLTPTRVALPFRDSIGIMQQYIHCVGVQASDTYTRVALPFGESWLWPL